jgi:orotidine-5'-phosphate decarboxylase
MTDLGPARTEARNALAFALDYPTLAEARAGAERAKDHVGVLKVGLQLFIREGEPAVRLGSDLGCEVFLDLKLHDIPATVERAVGSVAQLGVRYITIHAGGGPAMIEAAAKRADAEGTGLKVLAVTVLTSMDDSDLRATGVASSSAEQVARLAELALGSGAHGLVCSTAEVGSLRNTHGPTPILVTPGIRPAGGNVGDQKRVGTPESAIRDGASLLVVGRPIRDAKDPALAAEAIVDEIARAQA